VAKESVREAMCTAADELEMIEWFSQHCVAARHIKSSQDEVVTIGKGGMWEIMILDGGARLTFGSSTFLGAIREARAILER
jgi:hypothetical protein